jgi:hypothetical protein
VDYLVTDLPRVVSAYVRVQLTSNSGDALLGELVVGQARVIGTTQYGAAVGIQDYSIKQANDFGEYTIVERAYHRLGDFTLWMEPSAVDALQSLLASYRALPVVYIGADDFGSTILYGFFKSFNIEIAYPSYSLCTLSVEGLG